MLKDAVAAAHGERDRSRYGRHLWRDPDALPETAHDALEVVMGPDCS